MSNKIGRNASCPCGSGKKNKKCCNISNKNKIINPSNPQRKVIKSFEFIESNNSIPLLNFIIALQLKPNNH